jgi:hypothetical protein
MTACLQRWLVVVATVATLVVNTLAGAVGINGSRTGEIANRYDLPFTPSGWVFSIWSLIYAGLVAFTVFQLTSTGRRSARVAELRPIYVFTAAANCAWLWFWHHAALAASLVVMLLLLGALVATRRTLARGPPPAAPQAWCVDAPFGLYLAWITVATLANLGAVATSGAIGGVRADPIAWSQGTLAASFVIALFVFLRLRDPLWLAVIGWAAAGIALKRGQELAVSLPAMVLCALAGLGCIDLLLEAARRADRQSTTG